jgi:hypothetical protein
MGFADLSTISAKAGLGGKERIDCAPQTEDRMIWLLPNLITDQ